ncbi:unnamed protein product [Dracunculus medinensis]|uniref:Uncharacterized protein n=1 Tax=Dracunculus medinensis TaxID=318479 RepID=A0A0N4U5M1_DRAME|nr:unnamed protein product [Dracunculus medinensis]
MAKRYSKLETKDDNDGDNSEQRLLTESSACVDDESELLWSKRQPHKIFDVERNVADWHSRSMGTSDKNCNCTRIMSASKIRVTP